MGIWDAISEIVEAATPWSVVEAEAPVPIDPPKVSRSMLPELSFIFPLCQLIANGFFVLLCWIVCRVLSQKRK